MELNVEMVENHLSYLDFVVVGSIIEEIKKVIYPPLLGTKASGYSHRALNVSGSAPPSRKRERERWQLSTFGRAKEIDEAEVVLVGKPVDKCGQTLNVPYRKGRSQGRPKNSPGLRYTLDDKLETEVLEIRGGDGARFRDVSTKFEMK